jgi:hypothetical protein
MLNRIPIRKTEWFGQALGSTDRLPDLAPRSSPGSN